MHFTGEVGVTSSKVVRVKDHLPVLAVRAACDELFNHTESLPADNVVADFDTFTIASRSFIHQYLLRKERSNKKISEINLHPVIARMLSVVKKQIEESKPSSANSHG
ncbi:hypothetical protein B9Q03_06850 [Candidatus Marsarchaeota G2 archaeon OSP_D]|jgi:hypothetical protein|uniref:DUF4325 domain-containing protein n=2 Tax=Candidatus Marsarchaeota group 2 TaxID=2203771 RepID=A0A2R6C9S7_9ARCH|nr:MAG: hypothetical protein B9Q03_06850 [Candidatus Marsarchaeota G2 archaeon OSP_D]PSO07614.1 MAG: hypothetical protein B9Q04_09940 [Candidatus Marsarchaeota G2 archaeon BE_D]